MDTILFVWNQNFTRDGEKCTKDSWTVTEAKSNLHGQLIRIRQACEELSWNHRTSAPHRAETNGIAERAVRPSKRRNISSIVFMWTRGKVMVIFYGMLLLSARRLAPLRRRENSIWKTLWRIILRTYFTTWCTCGISSIWQESITRDFSGICFDRGRNLERRFWLLTLKNWKIWTHQK